MKSFLDFFSAFRCGSWAVLQIALQIVKGNATFQKRLGSRNDFPAQQPLQIVKGSECSPLNPSRALTECVTILGETNSNCGSPNGSGDSTESSIQNLQNSANLPAHPHRSEWTSMVDRMSSRCRSARLPTSSFGGRTLRRLSKRRDSLAAKPLKF
ncbi:hypothetical protein L596_008141 [Steinernema carpocapsae]|uniref:Uncharacterized protein n=1 Tax=Steinernema carpocapsae TaxID=34508 RepID=A0A4U5PBI8_STECR|nr:hypothetical protein L596_008141 [Steinernema carpocapsae]